MFSNGTRVKITNVDRYGFQGREFPPRHTHVGRVGYVLARKNEWFDDEGHFYTDLDDIPAGIDVRMFVYYSVGLEGNYAREGEASRARIVNCVDKEIVRYDSTDETCDKLDSLGC